MISRRQVMVGAAMAAVAGGTRARSQTAPPPRSSSVLPDLPYRRIEVRGTDALSEWQRLRAAGPEWPVVIGDDEAMSRIAEQLSFPDRLSPAEILRAAAGLTHPTSLQRMRAETEARFRASLPPDERDEVVPAPVGQWPRHVDPVPALSVASDPLSGRLYDRVHILMIPTRSGWEVPAYLGWGGWNDCPGAEYHVAALRSWHDRHGAELVGISGDVMDVHVRTRPATRQAALALAREQYLYCADIVDQGVESLSALAATLMASDWWYFWWD